MKANVGSADKVIRIIVGIALLAWAVLGTSPMHNIGWIGIVPIATALFSFCPLYTLLGIRTCPAPKQ